MLSMTLGRKYNPWRFFVSNKQGQLVANKNDELSSSYNTPSTMYQHSISSFVWL
ncbi:protein of unknown function [Vibrio tapetis subsp. tapetis]|uniref:Uncharacterized protein n=1 Tax=Vibrio tapetis subsp. tapetis TaxID=1671868 RepID=A0A2N8ZMJ2_9VIBR|nr:protein of unknown function [Vibrio tapetis subsp. tapetis]